METVGSERFCTAPTFDDDSCSSSSEYFDVQNTDDIKMEMTLTQLDELAGCLVCSKCGELPTDEVWMLGPCLHKYCKDCGEETVGKKCVRCEVKGYPGDVKLDSFSSSILSEIAKIYSALRNTSSLEENSHFEEEDENINKDNLSKDPTKSPCSPAPISQDFPDVFEETPQNKTKGRNSLFIPIKALDFGSPDVDMATNIPDQVPMSPGQSDTSEVDLFPSQPDDGDELRNQVDLPFLTPYENTECITVPKPNVGISQNVQLNPPTLTPYKQPALGTVRNELLSQYNFPILTPYESNGVAIPEVIESFNGNGKPPELTPHHKHPSAPVRCRSEEVVSKRIVSVKRPKTAESANKEPQPIKKREYASSRTATPVQNSLKSTNRISTIIRRLNSPGSIQTGNKELQAACLKRDKKTNSKGETDLHLKCKAGLVDQVVALIAYGIDVNAKDNAGWAPIHEAINGKGTISQKEQIVQVLCDNGADVNALGYNDETPLHCAAIREDEALVKLLLDLGASPNIRNQDEKLPKELIYNSIIKTLLEEKEHSSSGSLNLNTSIVEEDPAVMKAMIKKAIIFFNFDVDPEMVKATEEKLGLRVATSLTSKVTHVIHEYNDRTQRATSRVQISYEYLFGLAHCMWQVSSSWISMSLQNGECVLPTPYEIKGIVGDKLNADSNSTVPCLSRINKERGYPGLFSGMCFYLYKTCSYCSDQVKMKKEQLAELITGSGGTVTNREPNPNAIDINPDCLPFHANNTGRGDPTTSNPFALTSHIILFNDRDGKGMPPASKRYQMEHIKTLKVAWLIESLREFRLKDPGEYL